MTYKWEELTSPQFAAAVEDVKGTCLVPCGIIERHGPHLPLGTDLMIGRVIAARAVELEPAILFPDFYFGQIYEARHQPGTLAFNSRVVFDLLENVCEEIARNGLMKIVLMNAHGGNTHLLRYFAQCMLEKTREYAVYVIGPGQFKDDVRTQWEAMRESETDGHAGEMETSIIMAAHPDTVDMQACTDKAEPRGRLKHLKGVHTPIWWYADFPDHYAGDGRVGTAEKGTFIIEHSARSVAEALKIIKADTETEALQREFYERTLH
jgi:creatinine amidohydrolase